MYLNQLEIAGFKNYQAASFNFSPHLNFITGRNGSGKTNLLDAVHYLCLGKSYFHVSDLPSVSFEQNFFRLNGLFGSDLPLQIACTYQAGGRKELSHDGIAYTTLASHVGLIPIVMAAPDDQALIDGGSEERRRFLDVSLSQISRPYLDNLLQYNRVLAQRNAWLRQLFQQPAADRSLVESFDPQLASYGRKIFEARERFFKRLEPLVVKYYSRFSEGHEQVSIQYDSVHLNHNLEEVLRETLSKDLALQRTTSGSHRDDLHLLMNERPLRRFGSQGQKKSMLLALKFSQYEIISADTLKQPLFLMDDLFDKLDLRRSREILRMVTESGFGQVLITDTEQHRSEEFLSATGNSVILLK